MSAQPTRRLTLVDVMIIIGAVAVGFGGVRAESANHYHYSSSYLMLDQSHPDYANVFNGYKARPQWSIQLFRWFGVGRKAAPVVAALSLGLLAIRLRRPRPTWRRLIRQPGFIAGSSVGLVLGLILSLGLTQILLASVGQSGMTAPQFYGNFSFLLCQTIQPSMAGVAVLASWLVLGLSGRWRREPGWVDMAGVVIGLIWVGSIGVEWVVDRLK